MSGFAAERPVRYAAWMDCLTAREIVRTALILGAIWVAVSAIASVPSAVVGLLAGMGYSKPSPDDFLETILLALPLSVVMATVFGLLPAWFIYAKRDYLSSRLVADTQTSVEIRSDHLFGAGMIVLGVSFFVRGVSHVIAGTVLTISRLSSSSIMPFSISDLPIVGLVYLIAGVCVYRYGSRALLHAA